MATYSIWCGPIVSLSSQTAVFGDSQAAITQRWKPVDAVGNTVSVISYIGLISGSITGWTVDVSTGWVRFGGAAGAPNGAVLRFGVVGGGTVDVTILALPNTLTVTTAAELDAAMQAIAPAGGKDILVRMGVTLPTLPVGTVEFGKNISYASRVTVRAEGTRAQLEAGKCARIVPYLSVNNCSNITWEGFEVHNDGTGPGNAIEVTNTCNGIILKGNYIHAIYYAPMVVHTSWSNASGIDLSGTLTNLTITENLIENVSYGIKGNIEGATTVTFNEIRFFMNDAMYYGWTAPSSAARVIMDNVICCALAMTGETHSDAIAFSALSGDFNKPTTGLVVRQNVIFNAPTVSAGTIQGITAFNEDVPERLGKQMKDAIFAGNIIAVVNGAALAIYNVNGGFFGYNIVVSTSDNAVDDTGAIIVSPPTMTIGLTASVNSPVIKKNVVDGLGTYATAVVSDNIINGVRGTIVPYSSSFVWPNTATPAASYAQLMAWLKSKAGGAVDAAGAGPFSSGYATYGSPRNPAGWSYNPALEA